MPFLVYLLDYWHGAVLLILVLEIASKTIYQSQEQIRRTTMDLLRHQYNLLFYL